MKHSLSKLSLAALTLLLLLLSGCNDGKEGAAGTPGSNGSNGADGAKGANGSDGLASLVRQYQLPAGSIECNKGGVVIEVGWTRTGMAPLTLMAIVESRQAR